MRLCCTTCLAHNGPNTYDKLVECAGLRDASIAADLQATFNDVMKLPGALSVISSSPDLINVTELDAKLTREELHSHQSVGKKDPVWVDWHDWIEKKHFAKLSPWTGCV